MEKNLTYRVEKELKNMMEEYIGYLNGARYDVQETEIAVATIHACMILYFRIFEKDIDHELITKFYDTTDRVNPPSLYDFMIRMKIHINQCIRTQSEFICSDCINNIATLISIMEDHFPLYEADKYRARLDQTLHSND